MTTITTVAANGIVWHQEQRYQTPCAAGARIEVSPGPGADQITVRDAQRKYICRRLGSPIVPATTRKA